MWRQVISGGLALVVLAGLLRAQDKKPQMIGGIIKKIDVKKNLLIVTVKVMEKDKDTEVKISDGTRFIVSLRSGKKEFKGQDGLKAEEFKAGAPVRVILNADGEAQQVVTFAKPGQSEQPRPTGGIIKKLDAAKGVFTLTIKGKDKDKDMEVKVSDDTVFVGLGSEGKKQIKGKDGLKSDLFKVGTAVMVLIDPKGKVLTVMRSPSQPGQKPPAKDKK
jgi:hypothetical protein